MKCFLLLSVFIGYVYYINGKMFYIIIIEIYNNIIQELKSH